MIKDGDWTLFDYNYQTGRSVWSYFDGEKTTFRTDYPVDNLVSKNEAVRNSAEKAWKGDWHHVASVPLNVFHNSGLSAAGQQGDDKFVSRYLNSSDNRDWRVKEGQV